MLFGLGVVHNSKMSFLLFQRQKEFLAGHVSGQRALEWLSHLNSLSGLMVLPCVVLGDLFTSLSLRSRALWPVGCLTAAQC